MYYIYKLGTIYYMLYFKKKILVRAIATTQKLGVSMFIS